VPASRAEDLDSFHAALATGLRSDGPTLIELVL
jgi:hypothetical protein